jgi:hypothetical protein
LKCVVSAVKGGQAQGFLTSNQHLSGFGRFLTLNQHLSGFLIPQRHLAGLDRFGRQPLRKNNVW